MDALNFVGRFIISPYTLYTLKSHIAFLLVRFVPSKSQKSKSKKDKHRKSKNREDFI